MSERTLGGGRYVLREPPIGAGGMGTVWRAYDTVLHRDVAVKELRIPPGLRAEEHEKLLSRAMREARAAAGLDHPGIVTIHDVVDEDGRPWIVMRLLSGPALDIAVQNGGPLSPGRVAELGLRLLDALAAAHANGVLHRDVKPQNVMLAGDGGWLLTDFGIASVAGATRTLTATGLVTGTLGYVAPERLSGAEPGPAADLWSLGATLYFAVEGRPAYDHDDLPAMIAAVLTRDPAPPRLAGPLAPVIAGLLERDPGRRMDARTAREWLLAATDGRPTKMLPQSRKSYGLTGLMAVLNGAVGALVGLIVSSLASGMPGWIAVLLVGCGVVGGVLGAVLAPWLAQRLGSPTALLTTALLMGGSMIVGGVLARPDFPLPVAVFIGLAVVSFAASHRLANTMRPSGALYWAIGLPAILFGGVVANAYVLLSNLLKLTGFVANVVAFLIAIGVVVTLAGLSVVRSSST